MRTCTCAGTIPGYSQHERGCGQAEPALPWLVLGADGTLYSAHRDQTSARLAAAAIREQPVRVVRDPEA